MPALARLLGTDINALFGFDEEMEKEQLGEFLNRLAQTANREGLQAAFEMGRKEQRQYPHCGALLYNMALVLKGMCGLLGGKPDDEQASQITCWLQEATREKDEAARMGAAYTLAGEYAARGEYQQAEELLNQVPQTAFDVPALQAQILCGQGKPGEGAVLLQRSLLQCLIRVQGYLCQLIQLEYRDNQPERAAQVANIAREMVPLFGMWPYGQVVPQLTLVLEQQNKTAALNCIKQALTQISTQYNMAQYPLYARCGGQIPQNVGERYRVALVEEIKNESEYDFLRGEELDKILAECGQ